MIDDDAIRDLVVSRTARRLCVACAAPAIGSFEVREHLEVRSLAETIEADTRLRSFVYPCCESRRSCGDWVLAQELMGRLPHQSMQTSRARWAVDGEGWMLDHPGDATVLLRPYGGGWMGRMWAPGVDRVSSPMDLASAQTWAEVEVVRLAERPSDRRAAPWLAEWVRAIGEEP